MVTEAGVASAWIVSLTECVSLGDGTAKLAALSSTPIKQRTKARQKCGLRKSLWGARFGSTAVSSQLTRTVGLGSPGLNGHSMEIKPVGTVSTGSE